tara:strand:+ start:11153 stop:11608 length:456 start_codon:yes stop_codon:yes gene_type:complete
MTDKISVRKARAALKDDDENLREAVTQELTALAASEITDVLFWDETGRVTLTSADQLEPRVRKAIKKVKVTPGRNGTSIEVEMHDKIAPLRLLAKHTGMLDGVQDQNKPSVIGINLKGPAVTNYEVIEDEPEPEMDSDRGDEQAPGDGPDP